MNDNSEQSVTRPGWKYVYAKQWRTLIHVPESIADELRDALDALDASHMGVQRREDRAKLIDRLNEAVAFFDQPLPPNSPPPSGSLPKLLRDAAAALALPHTGQPQEGTVLADVRRALSDYNANLADSEHNPDAPGDFAIAALKMIEYALSAAPASPRAEGE